MAYRSLARAADELGVSVQTVRRGIKNGRIPAVQVFGDWRIPGSFFEELEATAYGRSLRSEAALIPRQRTHRSPSSRRPDWNETPDPTPEMNIIRPARKSSDNRVERASA